MVRDTAKLAGITLTREWKPCVGCSKAKATWFVVPKTTNERADEPLSRVFCYLEEAMKHLSVSQRDQTL